MSFPGDGASRSCPLPEAQPGTDGLSFHLYVRPGTAFRGRVFYGFRPISHRFSSPLEAALQIKDRVREQMGFTVNIGISTNRLLAKMASDFEKPDRVHTLFPDEIQEKMWPLPLMSCIWWAIPALCASTPWGSTPSATWPAATAPFWSASLKAMGSRCGNMPTA